MAGDPPTQEEEVDTSKIQLGIFVPSQTVQRNSTKKRSKKQQSARGEELETTGGQENTEESRQRTRGKRKRLDSSDGVNDRTPDQPSADERTENDTESGPTAAKSKRKRKRRKNKAKQSKVGSTAGSLMATDQQRALDYLSSWDSGSDGWTFRKKTQYWLLQNAYDKSKVSLLVFQQPTGVNKELIRL